MSWKKSFLVIYKCLRLILDTLPADDKYSLLDRDNLRKPIHMQLSQKQKTFSELVSAFLEARINFAQFQQKDDAHTSCISEITDSEIRVEIKISKFLLQRTSWQATWSGDQNLLKSEPHHLYHIYWSLSRQLRRKKSFLVICKCLILFLNTLTANDKYSLLSRENLRQPIPMQLSRERKTFSEFVPSFLKSTLNFEHFQIKYDSHTWCISEITDSEKRC